MTVMGVCTVVITALACGVTWYVIRECRARAESHRFWLSREREKAEKGYG